MAWVFPTQASDEETYAQWHAMHDADYLAYVCAQDTRIAYVAPGGHQGAP
jgi:hypothetical protein